MGYKGEKASLNQYSLIKDYLMSSGAVDQIKQVYSLTEDFFKKIERNKIDGVQVVDTKTENVEPFKVVAFDAGMARFFKDSPYEVVVLKIAGGCEESTKKEYLELVSPEFSHVFSGLVKNPRVFSEITHRNDRDGAAVLGAQEISRLFDEGLFKKFNSLMNSLFEGDFKKEVETWLSKSKKLPEIDNLSREFAEWYFILRAALKKDGDVMIIKDGSLITNQFGSGQALADRLAKVFSGNSDALSNLIVGVVKESRFIKDEGHIVSKTIRDFSKNLKGNKFFRIPAELEAVLDQTAEENKTVDRLFLSVSSGKNVYEVQFPRSLTKNPEIFEKARATLLSQITSLYGGSIAANSLAHKAASLSEAESSSLEKELRKTIGIRK